MAILEVEHINKTFGRTEVLKDISFSLERGQVLSLIGSSGSGKTTLLRCLNFLETPDKGVIRVNDELLFDAANPVTKQESEIRKKRLHFGLVFQSFNLFPQYTALGNVMLAKELLAKSQPDYKARKKEIHAEIEAEAKNLLDQMGLSERMNNYPHQLSGGQCQRVAIARSLVNNPKVLLLDEPLGALDLQLRRAMQLELKRLQKKLGITFIYITHDQEEAINMSDRIAVMNKGTFEQIGTPDEIYNHPKTSYVATFVGNANILKGTAQETEADILKVSLAGSIVSAVAEGKKIAPGTPVTLAVRSENMIFDETCQSGMEAVVVEKSFAGGLLRVVLKLADGTEVIANRHGIDAGVQPGQKVTCHFDAENAVLVDLPSETESGAAV